MYTENIFDFLCWSVICDVDGEKTKECDRERALVNATTKTNKDRESFVLYLLNLLKIIHFS